jgi:hypothetical protein
MASAQPEMGKLREEYLRELSGVRAVWAVRVAAVVVVVINTVFIWLDRWAYPQISFLTASV